jgi:aminomethyltransferase
MTEAALTATREEYAALRQRVVVTPAQHRVAYLIEGDDAFDLVDQLVTGDLFLQPAQLRQSLILDEDGLVEADVIVGRDEDGYLLVADAPSAEPLERLLRTRLAGGKLSFLHEEREALGLHGPYAWELIGAWLGADLVGMPYLSCFRMDDILVLRAGTTGEYGYEVLIPKIRAAAARAELCEVGRRFELGVAGESCLALAALENGFFDIRREGQLVRDPLELQLRWRLSNDKDYRGRNAVVARAQAGIERRITWIRSEGELAVGDRLEAFGEDIGAIVNAALSPRQGWIALGQLSLPWAHAGIDAFGCLHAGKRLAIRTVAPPLLRNRSLRVSPQQHSYFDPPDDYPAESS